MIKVNFEQSLIGDYYTFTPSLGIVTIFDQRRDPSYENELWERVFGRIRIAL